LANNSWWRWDDGHDGHHHLVLQGGRVVVDVELQLLCGHPWQIILGGDGMMVTMGIIFDIFWLGCCGI
jgi:hypothetical protein